MTMTEEAPMPHKTTEKLLRERQKYESLCRQLWPHVRFFGVCGAHPEAVQAVVGIGELIGETQQAEVSVNTDAMILQREAVVIAAVEFIRDSGFVNGKIGGKLSDAIASELKKHLNK